MARPGKGPGVYAALDRAGASGMTVKEICEAVPCTAKVARRHLTAFLDNGSARRERLETSPGRKGAPPFLYFLAKHRQESMA